VTLKLTHSRSRRSRKLLSSPLGLGCELDARCENLGDRRTTSKIILSQTNIKSKTHHSAGQLSRLLLRSGSVGRRHTLRRVSRGLHRLHRLLVVGRGHNLLLRGHRSLLRGHLGVHFLPNPFLLGSASCGIQRLLFYISRPGVVPEKIGREKVVLDWPMIRGLCRTSWIGFDWIGEQAGP